MNDTDTDCKHSVPLPRQPGSYLLLLKLAAPAEIHVGRLGAILFQRGWYAYAGSAFGPGGLAGRLRHHLRPAKKPHWHIDYLRAHAVPVEVWMVEGPPCREHDWARALAEAPGEGKWVRGFGSSDCGCPSHLIYFNRRPAGGLIISKLGTESCAAIERYKVTRWPPDRGPHPDTHH